MALNVWTPFRADEHIARGGAMLGAGIGAGLESLGDSISRALEQKKQRGQLVTSLRKTLSIAYPDRKDEFNEMNLEDLQGTVKGEAIKSAMEDRKRAIQLDEAVRQEREQRALSLQDALANEQRAPAFLGRMNELRQPRLEGPEAGTEGPANQVPGADNISAMLQASQETGYRPDLRGAIDDLLKGGAGVGAAPLSFEEDSVTGARFARGGNTILPSGTNPSKQNMSGQEIFDADGNLLGHNVPTGGGKFSFRPLKATATGQLQPVLDPTTGKPVPGFGMDATGRVHDLRDDSAKKGYDRLLGGGRAPAAPSGAAKFKFNPKTGQLDPAN